MYVCMYVFVYVCLQSAYMYGDFVRAGETCFYFLTFSRLTCTIDWMIAPVQKNTHMREFVHVNVHILAIYVCLHA